MLKNLGGRKVAQAGPKTWRKEPNIAPLHRQGILKPPFVVSNFPLSAARKHSDIMEAKAWG